MRFHIHTFGCRVNYAESEKLSAELQQLGLLESEKPEADLVILNTCAVTAKAVKEARQLIHTLKEITPEVKVIATGCSATLWAKEKANIAGLDEVVENTNKEFLAEIIRKRYLSGAFQPVTHKIYSKFLESTRLMVKVQDGCDYFCTYCIVPYLRGRSVSYQPEKVFAYIQKMQQEKSINEVVLTGINLGLYQDQFNQGLAGLTKFLLKETSIPKFSFGSLYVENLTPEFFTLWQGSEESRLTRYFHVPIQSGNQKTLSLMRRRYTIEEFDQKVKALHQAVPDALLATDVIVGFLEETEADFEATYKYLEQSPFSRAHIFTYSKRELTAGYYLAKRMSEPSSEQKKARSKRLHELFAKKLNAFQSNLLDQTVKALIIKEYPDYYLGFLSNGLEIKLPKETNLAKEFVNVKIEKIKNKVLVGKLAA